MLFGGHASAQTLAETAASPEKLTAAKTNAIEQILVTASTKNLLGRASTAGEGSITAQEVRLRPIYRPGQLLETVPGLEVTSHAGEGKANQYLLRGFNLDHGTDLATFVDDMPVNERTHGHGQGYTDLNFLIPELVGGIDFTKGPYYADEGDFASIGSDHIRLADTMPTTLSASIGTLGDQRVFGATSHSFADSSRLLAAGEFSHLEGPWDSADHLRKSNALLRWSRGTDSESDSLTGMYYFATFKSSVDQPQRAVYEGLIGRFGTLDPSDGGRTERFSLSARTSHALSDDWHFDANAYAIRYQFLLRNDFTHFLFDPVNGDQNQQADRRSTWGGAASLTRSDDLGFGASETRFGLQGRYDDIDVSLSHDKQGQFLNLISADHVDEGSISIYAQNTMRWLPWFRTVLGARGDFVSATDQNFYGGVSGKPSQQAFEPKASLILGPWFKTEFYASAGQGIHTNDVRDGTNTTLGGSTETGFTRSPLIVKSTGADLGARSNAIPKVQLAASLFLIDFQSELTYDGDTGTTEAGPASHRIGFEITSQYRPRRWLELSANFAATRSRYTENPDGGLYIPDSPTYIGSFGALVDHLGPWFGGLEVRALGPHPLTDDDVQKARGYTEINLDLGYHVTENLRVQMNIFNLLNTHGAASEYYYQSRLQGEPAEGLGDHQIHPLEPLSARIGVTATF